MLIEAGIILYVIDQQVIAYCGKRPNSFECLAAVSRGITDRIASDMTWLEILDSLPNFEK